MLWGHQTWAGALFLIFSYFFSTFEPQYSVSKEGDMDLMRVVHKNLSRVLTLLSFSVPSIRRVIFIQDTN